MDINNTSIHLMNAEKANAFQNFNWSDLNWQEKLSSYDIPLTMLQIPKVQKKWYRDNIDHEFDIEADLENLIKGASQPPQNAQQSSNQNYQERQSNPATDLSGNRKFMLEGYLKLIFMIITFVNIQFPYHKMITLFIGVTVCI